MAMKKAACPVLEGLSEVGMEAVSVSFSRVCGNDDKATGARVREWAGEAGWTARLHPDELVAAYQIQRLDIRV